MCVWYSAFCTTYNEHILKKDLVSRTFFEQKKARASRRRALKPGQYMLPSHILVYTNSNELCQVKEALKTHDDSCT